MKRLLALLALLAACDETGTVYFRLAFPPGQQRLPAEATSVRLTLSAPRSVAEGPVAADGSFQVALEVPADGRVATVTLEALDASGAVIAIARSAPVPLAAYTDLYTLYVSPPGLFAEAPVSLSPARSRIGAAPLPYGVLLAGGSGAAGAVDTLEIYDVYAHAFFAGEPLPDARAGIAAFADAATGLVYLVGGADAAEAARPDYLIFDTSFAPAGRYIDVGLEASLARADAAVARFGDGRFLVTGNPPLLIDPTTGDVTVWATGPSLPGPGSTAVSLSDGRIALTGPDGTTLVSPGLGTTFVPTAARFNHAAVSLPGGAVLLVGGEVEPQGSGDTDDAQLVDAAGEVTVLPDVLSGSRRLPAIARTGDEILVIGGFDSVGVALADADVLAAVPAPISFARTVPLATERGGAQAFTLANDAILLVGGTDRQVGGAAIGTVEIYQPR